MFFELYGSHFIAYWRSPLLASVLEIAHCRANIHMYTTHIYIHNLRQRFIRKLNISELDFPFDSAYKIWCSYLRNRTAYLHRVFAIDMRIWIPIIATKKKLILITWHFEGYIQWNILQNSYSLRLRYETILLVFVRKFCVNFEQLSQFFYYVRIPTSILWREFVKAHQSTFIFTLYAIFGLRSHTIFWGMFILANQNISQ